MLKSKKLGSLVAIGLLGSLTVLSLPQSAQANSRVEYRTHCVWKRGGLGMMYKSCSPQTRVCHHNSAVGGGNMTSCTSWKNR
jgi:hypothetical protein